MKHTGAVNFSKGDIVCRKDLGQAMKANDIVKYSKPVDEEEVKLRFILLRSPEKGRADIQLICDYHIKPIQTVTTEEIEPADGR